MPKNNTETSLCIDVYLQDPLVAAQNDHLGFDTLKFEVESNLGDGPTSARFAVVDYNGQTLSVTPPSVWDKTHLGFRKSPGKKKANLDRNFKPEEAFSFRQVHVWALAQEALHFFEESEALGRRIPWAFPGNRLYLLPHAGLGQNAYYDRQSKSLQFYYFPNPNQKDQLIYTCLSADIVRHEFGHAILDGIRPGFLQSPSPETAAFHEFIGDLTAILLLFRNNTFRKFLSDDDGGEAMNSLAYIAEEFGKNVKDRPFLRSAQQDLTMFHEEIAGSDEPHLISTVLTGACFEIMMEFARRYQQRKRQDGENLSEKQAFWYTIGRAQRLFLQPLDFLPPVDAKFRDYAIVVLRNLEISDPIDPYGYREILLDVFVNRGILSEQDRMAINKPHYLFDRNFPDLKNEQSPFIWSRSKAAAYRFLDANRQPLGIPLYRDFQVLDVYESQKSGRQGHYLPKQFVVEYVWQEETVLTNGAVVAFPCGGTLAYDENNNLVHWALKPGTESEKVQKEGIDRKKEFDAMVYGLFEKEGARQPLQTTIGLLEQSIPSATFQQINGLWHVQRTPHLDLNDFSQHQNAPSWQPSF